MSDEDSSGWELTESDPGVFTCVLNPITYRHRDGILVNNQGTPENSRCTLHR